MAAHKVLRNMRELRRSRELLRAQSGKLLNKYPIYIGKIMKIQLMPSLAIFLCIFNVHLY